MISQWCVRVWFRVCMNVRETHIVFFLSCTSHAAISFGRSRTGQKFWSCAVVLWTEVPGKRALARWNGCVCLCDYLCLFLWILKTICSTMMFFHFLYGPHEKSWTKTILDFFCNIVFYDLTLRASVVTAYVALTRSAVYNKSWSVFYSIWVNIFPMSCCYPDCK